jgi:hypothetical protein
MKPVPTYPIRKSSSDSLTDALTPEERFLASVQSELMTAVKGRRHPARKRQEEGERDKVPGPAERVRRRGGTDLRVVRLEPGEIGVDRQVQ